MITFSPLFLGRSSLVGGVISPPIYNLTEEILYTVADDFYWVRNSAQGVTSGHGKLYKGGNNAWSAADVQSRYTELGTIDLSPNGDYWIDTGWIAPDDEEWSMMGIYDIVSGTSYSVYVIEYLGNNTCNVYLGNNLTDFENDFPDGPTYNGITYTPPVTNWIIYENPPEIVTGVPDSVIYDMSTFNTI